MTAVATNGIKLSMGKPSRGCFGGGMDFFKGDDHSNMVKYKSIAEAETARADANAEEIAVLRDMLSKLQGGEAVDGLIADSELRMKSAELTAKVEEQEEDIKKLKEALGVASTALESEESAKLAARVTASAAIDDLKTQIEALKAEKEAPKTQSEAPKAESAASTKAMDDLKAQNEALKAESAALKAETSAVSQEQQTAEARKQVEAMLAKQALQFDGAGNKNTQNSPLGVPQSWKLDSLDAKKKASNAKTLELLYDILKQYPDLYVQCHGETDADASKPADAVLAKFFGFNTMQPIQDRLAENRATAVQDALVSHGIPAERVVVTYKGCGGQSKVDIVPMPAAQALQKMRGNLMRQHTLDLQKISQVDALETELRKAKDDLAAEQAKSKAAASVASTKASAPPVVDTAALDAKQAELEAEKAKAQGAAAALEAEKAKTTSLEAKTASLEADLAASKKAEAEGAAAAAAAATAAAASAATAASAAAATAAATAADAADAATATANAEKAKEAASQAAAVQAEAEKAAATAKAEEEKAATAAKDAAAAKEAALATEAAAKKASAAPPPGLPPSAVTAASAPVAAAVAQAPGVLRVKVISAAGLLAGDANGFSDPYAKVHLGANPEVVRKTHVMKKTLDPEWGEQFDFHGTLAEMIAAPLEVVLSDQDKGGIAKTSLGQVSLPFGAEVVSGKAMEGALSTQGSVKLFASFAPLKLVLSSNMHVKKRGISGGRYIMHHCTLSYAEGFDGWTSYRLAYRDSHDVEHAATVIGMSDNAPMRYEFTIVTHENQGYSIRCGTNAEYTQWTDAIKQIVAPPLSRGHAEEAVDGEVPAKKKGIFARATSLTGGKKKSTTE